MTYSLRDIQQALGLSRAVIKSLVDSGFVTPSRGARRELRFSFQDVVLLRTAHGLQAAQIPPRKIVRSLKRLAATLPSELPLTGLSIRAVGNEIAVKEGNRQWHAESGQLLFDFEVKPARGTVAVLGAAPRDASDSAGAWFDRGVALEGADAAASAAAYRRAIELAPDCVDAVLNLGVLLGNAGKGREAVALYKEALRRCPDAPLLHFNLAVALEDLQRNGEALASYEDCMRLDPKFADAHYNAARLHELLGHANKAIRHYSEYRRLQR